MTRPAGATARPRIAHNEQIRRIHVITMLRRERLPDDTGMTDIERQLRGHIAAALSECFRRARALNMLRDGIPPERAARGFQSQLIGLIHVGIQDPEASGCTRTAWRCFATCCGATAPADRSLRRPRP